jgi:hypothetical protein
METLDETQKALEQVKTLLAECRAFLRKFEPQKSYETVFHTVTVKNVEEALNKVIWAEEDLYKLVKLVSKRDNSG